MTRFLRRFRRHRTTLGVAWTIILFFFAFAYAMFQGGFVSWFVFYSFLPIILYTLAVSFYPLSDIEMTREIDKEELYADEPLDVTIEVSRRFLFPLLYLVIEDHTPENIVKRNSNLKKVASKGVFSFGFKKRLTFHYTIDGMPRGDYRFKSVTVKTGDIFGFVQKSKTFDIEQSVLVYPKIIPPQKWTPLDLSFGGRHRSKKHFEYDLTSISSIRDYIPGDRLSWLDWKATARTSKLVTKQFEYPINKDIMVVLDRTINPDDKNGERFERAVSLAASLTDRALRTGSSVGFISIGPQAVWVGMQDQSYQKWVILHHLAAVEPNGEADPSYAFNKYVGQMSHETTVVFITTKISSKMVLLFNDLISRGLAIEMFLAIGDRVPSAEDALLQRLMSMGVYIHLVRDWRFDEILKAGGSRATS
ncbi:DUF58 domain-containing protein [Camelliibacillus cellulosilyticus]|uniref:DUF58 domain-containing protein n=1 Tax=Camelliibacillus cellulosilyticus TaxID=2174486 RepID=UPI00366E6D0C